MDENNSTTKCTFYSMMDSMGNFSNNFFLISGLENERVLHKIFQYLDCNNLRQAENVCTLWGKVITGQGLWEKLYQHNV